MSFDPKDEPKFRDLYLQQWPAPTQTERQCFDLFPEEVAKRMVTRALIASATSKKTQDEILRDMIEAKLKSDVRASAFE